MLDWMQRINWDEYLFYLSQGHPPLGWQLVAINVMLLAFWVVRRARKRKLHKTQRPSTWLVPVLFVLGNVSVITWGSRLSM